MTSDELTNLMALLRASQISPDTPLADQRAGYELLGAMIPMPDGVHVEPLGDDAPVSGEWLTPDEVVGGRTLLYLHGGGYVIGSPSTHRSLAARLATGAKARVVLLDYRLAPEHPHPAALDDALGAYRWLVEEVGVDPTALAVAGDSAGGGLALASLVAARDAGLSMPAAAVPLSPWTDLTLSAGSIVANAATEVLLQRELVERWAEQYAGGTPLDAPLVSPLFADLTGLPPLLIHVAAEEALLDDATRLAERAAAAGVEVTCAVVAERFHVWHLVAGIAPEADEAVAEVAAWLDARLGG